MSEPTIISALRKAIEEEAKQIVEQETAKAAAEVERRIRKIGGDVAARLADRIVIKQGSHAMTGDVEYVIKITLT